MIAGERVVDVGRGIVTRYQEASWWAGGKVHLLGDMFLLYTCTKMFGFRRTLDKIVVFTSWSAVAVSEPGRLHGPTDN